MKKCTYITAKPWVDEKKLRVTLNMPTEAAALQRLMNDDPELWWGAKLESSVTTTAVQTKTGGYNAVVVEPA